MCSKSAKLLKVFEQTFYTLFGHFYTHDIIKDIKEIGYRLENYLKDVTLEDIIDFGCGTGRSTILLLNNLRIKYKELIGIDINKNLLNKALKNGYTKVMVLDITKNLEFNKKYDLVLTFDVLHHIEDKSKGIVIKNMIKCSKKYVLIIDKVLPKEKARLIMEKIWPFELGAFHFTYEDYINLLNKLKLKNKILIINRIPHTHPVYDTFCCLIQI